MRFTPMGGNPQTPHAPAKRNVTVKRAARRVGAVAPARPCPSRRIVSGRVPLWRLPARAPVLCLILRDPREGEAPVGLGGMILVEPMRDAPAAAHSEQRKPPLGPMPVGPDRGLDRLLTRALGRCRGRNRPGSGEDRPRNGLFPVDLRRISRLPAWALGLCRVLRQPAEAESRQSAGARIAAPCLLRGSRPDGPAACETVLAASVEAGGGPVRHRARIMVDGRGECWPRPCSSGMICADGL